MVAPDSEASANPRIVAAARESPVAAEARHSADLYIRTSWVDAALALSELEKVQCSLDMRGYSVVFRLSYCTCDCFSANANHIEERCSAKRWRQLVVTVRTIKAARFCKIKDIL